MALIETNDGLWFQEDLYPEIACGFCVSAVLHRETSAFQDILILDTPALGKVLALDGIVQCAQKDEFVTARDDIGAVFGPNRTRAGLLATCTYLGGWFTWLAAVKGMAYPEGSDALRTMRALFDQAALEVRWYSPEMQCAAQVLPGWLAKIKPNISGRNDIS